MSHTTGNLSSVIGVAARLGYRLQATVAADALTGHLPSSLPPAFRTLWIVCSTGDQVQGRWLGDRDPEEMMAVNVRAEPDSAGPLDDFCRSELVSLLGDRPHAVLFPSDRNARHWPLLPVLRAAGLLRPSPIMNSLHHRYGGWWAVRAVIALTEQAAIACLDDLGDSPCLSCDAPCVDACPGDAVHRKGWVFDACAMQRLREDSPCAYRCPARLACPAGAGFRYNDRVLHYHYGVSLQTLEAFAVVTPRFNRRRET